MKKKILFAAYSLDIGGIETALVTLLNYLAKKDYEITLVLEKKQGIFLDKINSKIKIIEYRPSYNKIKIFAKIKNVFNRFNFIRKHKNKYDFACSYATYSLACSFVARTASKNNALWVHNNYLDFFLRDEKQYKKFFYDIHCNLFRKIVFVSNESRNDFIERCTDLTEKTDVCNNLIDYEKIITQYNQDVDEIEFNKIIKDRSKKTKIFLNVGRHDEKQKKLSRLISAAKMLDDDGYDFKVLFVGKGEDTERYVNQVYESGLQGKIIFLGPKSNPYPYFKKSDCIVMTSDFEGYPVVYVEAMILEKVIITTDVSDSKFEIEDKYGFVCSKEISDIYQTMKKFIEDGYEIKTKFNPDIYNKNIISKVENFINGE